MAYGPVTLWQIGKERVKQWQILLSLGSKITGNGDCSHEIGRCLILGRKAMTNVDSILKSRDINLPTKVHLVKAMVFPVVMYGCEIRSDQSLSHVRLFATPWIAARQASLSITNSQSSLRLTSVKSVMPSSHLILCHPLLLLPSIFPGIRIFSSSTTIRKHQFFGPQPSFCSSSHIHTWLLEKP